VDVRRELYAGVVLTGGTALFSSLRDRLERELADSAPAMAKVKVVSPANAVERRFSSWIGGSILASLGTFQQMWMSKAEYSEHGAGLIHKKAP
jgi:actin-like protein 6A